MRRSANLDGDRIKSVIGIIRRMPEPVSWQGIVDAVERELGDAYTRQALSAHAPIRAAYDGRKRGEPARPGGPRLSQRARANKDRIDQLVAKVARAERERDACREAMARWAHNAFQFGMSEWELDAPLEAIDRSLSIPRGRRDSGAMDV